MDEEEEEEIPLDMEDVEAVSKKARQDEDLGTEHLQVHYYLCYLYHYHCTTVPLYHFTTVHSGFGLFDWPIWTDFVGENF